MTHSGGRECIKQNIDLFLALLNVPDLAFANMAVETQELLIKTLKLERYYPGDIIFHHFEVPKVFFW